MRRAAPEETQDGRRRRSEASRERIIRAMLHLLSEGEITPSAEAVAEQAGVGLRTVFRHFDNMDALYQQIYASIEAEVRPFIARPFAAKDDRGRVEEIVERRIGVFERIMPMKIAADVHRHRSAFLDEQARGMVKEQRQILLGVLPPRYGQEPVLLEALDLLLSFDTWKRLRKDQKLTKAKARDALRMSVLALIDQVGAEA